MKKSCFLFCVWLLASAWLTSSTALGNLPGGGTNGVNVTLTDNGTTVTIANGNVSILCTKAGASINQINYTYNNSGSSQTLNLLSGGTDGGKLYWENSNNEGLAFTYWVVANPANTGGNYAEIAMSTTSEVGDVLEVHFSMLRGSTGFYTTAIYSHPSGTNAFGMGECRDNIYAGSIFNWMCVDASRNRLMEVSGGSAIAVQGAPKEVSLWTSGIYSGQYEDKYKYSADLGEQRVWGWGSVGSGGENVGLWNISASMEYYNGGPLKRELMEHIGTTILNMLNGGHYAMGSDGSFATNETWLKVCGPYFIYCNNLTNSVTATNQAAQALYQDALAQGAAEQLAWPYFWFTNANYAPAASRGNVTGTMAISDGGNPNASAANLWVGLVQQPSTTDSVYDFQQWMKPYQFWTKTDTNGNFTLTNVIAGTNYTLYAFGPGAPDTFMSQSQSGGTPPLIMDLPANPFAISVAGGTTTNLGTVTWTPTRVGATVFEIGYPDRKGDKFRHGDDLWVGDIGPSAATPSPIWSKWLEYPFDFPSGVNYVVGQNRWSTDWNFIQPVVTDSAGNYNNSSSTITFNLATAPTNGATASLYLGLASDYYCALIVTVNGNNLANVGGVSGAPNNSIPATGYYVGYGASDTSIREGNNGAFSDERISFPASQLTAGVNTINIGLRQIGGTYFANHAMYDYVRLELTGYVPPPPASVAAYPGNAGNLVTWPVTPGATSYNLLRSTTAGSGYVALTNGVTGPVCGSGGNSAAFVDATAVNGATYYYVVRSVNPTGTSTNSPASAGATPAAGLATSAPGVPTGLNASPAHQSVTLNWNVVSGANLYSVWRSTLFNNGGGASNTLSTILLNNAVTNTSYTDASPSDGSIYSYFVTATSAGGTSASSTAVAAVPRPAAPAAAPLSFVGSMVSSNNTLNWMAVPGAVGYVIYRASSAAGPYTILMSITETTYTDYGLATNSTYYYKIVAVNDGGISSPSTNAINGLQAAPTSLSAVATNAQVLLAWPAVTGATSYILVRGTSIGSETTTVVSGYPGTSYTNTGLINGTTYYYALKAAGAGGTSGKSPEVSATPAAAGNGTWTANSGNWSDGNNWGGGLIASGTGYTADFSTAVLSSNSTVTLDSARVISGLKFGSGASGFTWTLAGTNALTLGSSPVINVLNQAGTVSLPLAGSSGLAKAGVGALTLNTAATFTNGLAVNAGTLILDLTATSSPAVNVINPTNGLALGGGTLLVNGTAGGSGQAFASTTVNAGGSVISLPANGAASPTNWLGTLTETVGGTVEFAGTGTNYTTTAGTGSLGCLGGFGVGKNGAWATVGLSDWASTDLPGGTAGSTPYTIVAGSQVSGFYQTTGVTTGGNYDVNASGVNSIANSGGAATLRYNRAAALTVNNSAYTFQNCQGILITPNCGANNETLSGASLEFIRSTSYGSCYGVIWQNNPQGYFNCSINLNAGRQGGQYNGLVQAGPGTVVYSGANTYELGAYLNGGFSVITAYNGFGQPGNGYNTVSAVTLNGGTVVGNATFTNDQAGVNARPFTLLGNGGGLAATAGNTMTVDGVIGSAASAGPLTIGIPAQSANGNVAGLLPGSGPGTANAAPVYATGTVVLTNANTFTGGTVLASGTLNFNGLYALGGANYGGVTFNGGTLQYAASFPGNNGAGDLTSLGGAGVTLAAGGGTLDVNGNSVTLAGAIGNGGSGAVTVKSTLANGSLSLLGANLYSGPTVITNVTLLVSNTSGSATGSGAVTVQNGAVLAGTGTLAGPVTITAGGTLLPGNPALTFGNNLTLAGGSWTQVALNNPVTVADTLTAGGTLVVTNNTGAALTNGASFQIFNAANYAGAFTNLGLPALAANLWWNTNTLLTAGTLSVVTPASPTLSAIQFSGTNLTVSGTGGIGNWPYVILSATNLAGPWTPVATNQFDASGNFSMTLSDALGQGQPQLYYRLLVP